MRQKHLGAYITAQYTIKTPNLFSQAVSENVILNQAKLPISWKPWTFFFSSSAWWFSFALFCCRPAVLCLKSTITRPFFQFIRSFWPLQCIIFYIISFSRLSPFTDICRCSNSSHSNLQLVVFLSLFVPELLADRLPGDSLLQLRDCRRYCTGAMGRIIYRKSFLKYFFNQLSF